MMHDVVMPPPYARGIHCDPSMSVCLSVPADNVLYQ